MGEREQQAGGSDPYVGSFAEVGRAAIAREAREVLRQLDVENESTGTYLSEAMDAMDALIGFYDRELGAAMMADLTRRKEDAEYDAANRVHASGGVDRAS